MEPRLSKPMHRSIGVIASRPILKETMTVQSYGRLYEVDKEQWMKEFNKSLGIGIRIQGVNS